MASRDLNKLHPTLKIKFLQVVDKCKSIGLEVIATCTSRDIKEQVALYAQGRQPIDEVNHLRLIAGMSLITSAQNKVVTWTMASRHVVDLSDVKTDNDLATAVDFAVVRNGKISWDIKADVNNDNLHDYAQVGSYAVSLGLEWGGTWKVPDFPHLQLKKEDI